MISTFTVIDFAFIAVLLIFGLIGFGLGITRMVLGIAGWIGAVVLTFYVYISNGFNLFRPFVQHYIKDPFLSDLAIGVVIFAVLLIALGFVKRSVSGYVKNSALSGVDRSLGLLFGVFLAVVLLSSGFLAMHLIGKPQEWPPSLQTARSTGILTAAAKNMSELLPNALFENLGVNPDTVKNHLFNTPTSAETLVGHLSQPQPSRLKLKGDEENSRGYKKDQVTEMDRLFENYE